MQQQRADIRLIILNQLQGARDTGLTRCARPPDCILPHRDRIDVEANRRTIPLQRRDIANDDMLGAFPGGNQAPLRIALGDFNSGVLVATAIRRSNCARSFWRT